MLNDIIAWYVSFGPHGPRAPLNPPGTMGKIIGGVTAIVAASTVIFVAVRSIGEFFFCCIRFSC
jgi:hypothetical protein